MERLAYNCILNVVVGLFSCPEWVIPCYFCQEEIREGLDSHQGGHGSVSSPAAEQQQQQQQSAETDSPSAQKKKSFRASSMLFRSVSALHLSFCDFVCVCEEKHWHHVAVSEETCLLCLAHLNECTPGCTGVTSVRVQRARGYLQSVTWNI